MPFLIIPQWTKGVCHCSFVEQNQKEMAVKKTIAIVGATEKNGTALIYKLAQGNYRLLLISNDPDQLDQTANQLKEVFRSTEMEAIDCLKDGCWEADIIFLAIPYQEIKDVVGKIKEVATQKIVVCISDNTGDRFPFPLAQQLQHLLPYSKIVTAFKNINSAEAFIAGDDSEAVATISGILKMAGYQPITADSLSSIKML